MPSLVLARPETSRRRCVIASCFAFIYKAFMRGRHSYFCLAHPTSCAKKRSLRCGDNFYIFSYRCRITDAALLMMWCSEAIDYVHVDSAGEIKSNLPQMI